MQTKEHSDMTIHASDNIYPLYKRETPEEWTVTNGMTKREHFAVMLMQGLVAHHGYGEMNTQEIAQRAVKLADALIDKLNNVAG
jgi:hypothetical protein